MRSSRVLVTSAAGNVGREVVRAISRAHGLVRAADDSLERVRRVHGEAVDAARLDCADPRTYDAALAGCSSLFLVRPSAICELETSLLDLVDAAIEHGVEFVVFISVAGAADNERIPHHAVERHLARSGVPHTLLRPGFFAQNLGAAYRDDIALDDRVFLPAGRARVAFVDIRDVAELAASILDDPTLHAGREYTCTGPEALSFEEAARILTEVTGRRIRYEHASIAGYVRHWHVRGVPLPEIGVQTQLHVGLRLGADERVDPTLEILLGRRLRTLETYVRDHARLWMRGAGLRVSP